MSPSNSLLVRGKTNKKNKEIIQQLETEIKKLQVLNKNALIERNKLYTRLKGEITQLERERDDFERELAITDSFLQQEQLTNQRKQNRFTNLQRRAENWRQQLAANRQKLIREQYRSQEIDFQYQNLQQIRLRLEREKVHLTAEKNNLTKRIQVETNDLTQALSSLEKETQKKEQFSVELAQTKATESYLRTTSNWLREDKNRLINQKHFLQAELKALEEKFNKSNWNYNNLIKEIENCLEKIKLLNTELEFAEETFTDYQKRAEIEVKRLREVLKESQENNVNLTALVNRFVERVGELNWELNQSQQELTQEQARRRVLQFQFHVLRHVYSRLRTELAQSQQNLNQATTQNDTLQTHLRNEQQDNRRLRDERDRAQGRADQFRREKANLEAEKTNLIQQKTDLIEIIWNQKNELNENKAEIKDLKNQFFGLERAAQNYWQYSDGQIRLLNQENNDTTQQIAKIIELNGDLTVEVNNYLQIIRNLEEELDQWKRDHWRSERSRGTRNNPQWRNSEATLFGDEEDQPEASGSRTINNAPVENNPGWKNYLWQNAKKLGLAALIYSGGYYHGSQNNAFSLVECNNLLSVPQNPTQNYKVIAYNQTHSWVENPLSPSPLPDFQSPKINQFPVVERDNNQTGLEQEIKQLKEKNDELAKRPTPEQLIKSVAEEKNKYRRLIDPTTYRADWINPTDLPENWPTELARIPKLEEEVEKTRANNSDLSDQLADTNQALNEKKGEIETLLLKLAGKDDEIAKQNKSITDLINQDQARGKQVNQKLADKDWAIKRLEDDLVHANQAQQKLEDEREAAKTELDEVKRERDARPDIKKEDWDKDYSKRPTQKQLDEAAAKVEAKFKGFIDPIKLIEEAKKKGMVAGEDLEATKKELDQKNDEITALTSQLATEKIKQKNEVDQLKKDLDQQKKEDKQERETLQDLMDNKDKENEKLKNEIEQVQKEKEKLTKVLEEAAPGAAKKITVGDYLVKGTVGIVGTYLSKKFIWDNRDKLWETFRQTPKVRSLEAEKEHFKTQTVNLTATVNDYTNKLADLEVEKEKLIQERDQYKACADDLASQLANHNCPPCQLTHGCRHQEHICPESCSENVHSKIRAAKEKEVVNRIIKDCQLKGSSDHNLDSVIQELQSLIALPGGECLKAIIRLEKETLGELLKPHLFANYSQQLEQVNNYQELAAQRSAIIKQQLAENTQELTTTSPPIWKRPQTILLGSLIITLLTAGGILIMKSRKNASLHGNQGLVKTEKLPSLQAINHYLRENNIKSLEIDEKGGLITRFKV
ncbi:MAG: hypothetical protein I3273_00225 [Candidatus Moeniiplasma glomeromycotorum]|nr:hypothetical protein [Candidatus Moeniiplasma glomeromycotorum]MCE8167445.1 hypothetical protein [Candidatus Moeniiplasma glomeromycotorum]MCE8168541.1 hypothetical protein [Candidatus Moeniiplasma glomeromycotorum]